jgi:hypothetical protein
MAPGCTENWVSPGHDQTLDSGALEARVFPGPAHILGYTIVLRVPGPGFQGRFWGGFGRKPSANGPKTGPKLPGTSARAVLNRFLVRSH